MKVQILPEYQRYEIPASRAGAKGEGVCILVHPEIAHGVCLWRAIPAAALLWVVVRGSVTGFTSDMYLGAVYVPPSQSALLRATSSVDRFAAISESASAASACGSVLLMGDFNARVADRPDVDDHAAAALEAFQLPVVRACTDKWFGGHGRHLLQLCLSAGLVLGTGRMHGDAQAPLSYPHAAGGSRPDHILLDVGLASALVRSHVDGTRTESDHLPLLAEIRCQPSGHQALPCSGNDGEPLPRLRWDARHREEYVKGLDGPTLQSCVHLAQHGSLAESCSKLSDTLVAAAVAAGCHHKPATSTAPARPKRDHRPFFDKECKDLKRLYQHTRSRDPEQAHVLRRKYASVVRRKCRVYRQQQTGRLLREIRRKPQDFWRKLNGRPAPLPQLLQRQDQWRQYMADLCAPASVVPPQPSIVPQDGAQHVASGMNAAISSMEVETALPLLNNNRSGAAQGWPSELLRYAYQEVSGMMARSASSTSSPVSWPPSWMQLSKVASSPMRSSHHWSLQSSRKVIGQIPPSTGPLLWASPSADCTL